MEYYLGIDVGSVSTNLVLTNEDGEVVQDIYLRTAGQPLKAVQNGLLVIAEKHGENLPVAGVGTTGSGREIASVFVGADVVKNEITAHAIGAMNLMPDVRTVLEIGGQDSKIIIMNDRVVVDFAMNTVCAAGTGSFLDRQADRLGVEIEDFGRMALQADKGVRIAGRCAVFAESDMIHKQQIGHTTPAIVKGLCDALVRNYLNNVGKGKDIEPPVVFQGGVACNEGMKDAFEEELGHEVFVPENNKVMGAIGSALLAQEEMEHNPRPSSFRGFGIHSMEYRTGNFECEECPNRCEILEIYIDEELAARWGGRCERWDRLESIAAEKKAVGADD